MYGSLQAYSNLFKRLAILQLMGLLSNSDVLVKSEVLPSQANAQARTTEQSACILLAASLAEETHGWKRKADALAQRNGIYTWTTVKWEVKKSSNLSYLRSTSK